MAHYLPSALMAFFQPRPPLEYKEPLIKKKMPPLHGVAQFVHRFKDVQNPEPVKAETAEQKKERRKGKKAKNAQERLKRQLSKWDPKLIDRLPYATKDAYKTLFVARLAYNVTEEDLKNEFEYYGNIVSVHLVKDKKGQSRGYAFIQFESSADLKEAYKDADGRKMNGRRILVDVERGRTVKNWRPRRLGGGLGATRAGGKDVNQKYSGRAPPSDISTSSSSGFGSRSSGHSSSRSGDQRSDRRDHRSDQRDRGGDQRRSHRDDRSGGDYHRPDHRDHRSDRGGGREDRDERRSGGSREERRRVSREREYRDRDRERDRSDRDDKRGERDRSRDRSRSRERDRSRSPHSKDRRRR